MKLIKPRFWDKNFLTLQSILLYPFTFILDLRNLFLYFRKTKKYDELLNIDGIGEIQTNSIKNFFSNNINLKVLNELEKVLNISDANSSKKNGLLKNLSFLVTGKLNGISRAEVKSLIEENSGTTVSSVSKKLNYLIIGEKPTKRKVENAKELKINIVNQNQFA